MCEYVIPFVISLVFVLSSIFRLNETAFTALKVLGSVRACARARLSEWLNESMPPNSIYGHMGAGKERSFKHHAQCQRGQTGVRETTPMWVGKAESFRKDAIGAKGLDGASPCLTNLKKAAPNRQDIAERIEANCLSVLVSCRSALSRLLCASFFGLALRGRIGAGKRRTIRNRVPRGRGQTRNSNKHAIY